MSEYEPQKAEIHEVDGQLVLVDPVASAIINALEAYNTGRNLFEMNEERIAHFKNRAAELGVSATDAVITIINVDDPKGSILSDMLMPGHNWQSYRDAGELPVARGLADREGIQRFLEAAKYTYAADKLREAEELSVVVVDHNTAEIHTA